MPDLDDRLSAALADRYSIERKIGAGGMATVYLARDLRHERNVALKVLRPDLAATLGSDRFLREIRIAANLTHPHILPLHDSGVADGFLYYTMPYIEGESLREKIEREGELPLDEAARILREVADALAHAHGHGVVHRDIKPDNVLLSGRHALVADFGVAKAVSEATGRDKITTAGMALGTPSYMAPEQAAADPHVDHRADIYAVGALGYELLAGRPPFTGATPQAVLAAHLTEQPRPVTEHRPAVPPSMALLIGRCLEKKAADRWQSADDLLRTLETFATQSGGVTPTGMEPMAGPTPTRNSPGRWALSVAAATAIGVGIWFAIAGGGGGPEVDENLVAVLPFRVAGAEAELVDLREGMVDLMATFLTGEAGTPRAADPGTVISVWRSRVASEDEDLDQAAAIELARSIGAGQLLTGSIVGSNLRLVVRGTLLHTERPTENFQVHVEGRVDSVFGLLPRFVGQLLAQSAGVDVDQTASLTTNSLPALRAYLRGQSDYRRARYGLAVNRFTEALEADSNFALAGVGLLKAGGWVGVGGRDTRVSGIARRAAWRNREALGVRDRAIVRAILGSNGPAPDWRADRLRAQEEAIKVAGDREEAWYYLGDTYFHYGSLLGIEDALERADQAFRRAMARDSSVAGVQQHLLLLAAMRHDTADVYRFLDLHEAAVGDSVNSLPERWFAAVAVGDSAIRDAAVTMLDTVESRARLGGVGILLPFRPDLLPQIRGFVDRGDRRMVTQNEREVWGARKAMLAWDAGRPGEAVEILRPFAASSAKGRVMAGLLGAGDRANAEAAYQLLVSGSEQAVWWARLGGDACVMALWRLETQGVTGTDEAVGGLRATAAGRDPTWPPTTDQICADLLEAGAASRRGEPNARALVDALEAELNQVPDGAVDWMNLVLARLLEAEGEYARAGAAAGRFRYFLGHTPFLAIHFRESGRLYDLAGNRERAVEQYSNYLTLMIDHEPALTAEVDEVREALARLTGEGR